MKRRMVRILGEIIVLLVGCLLLLLFQHELTRNIAVGLITAGITAVLFEGILKDEFLNQLRDYLKPPLRLVGVRKEMDRTYLRLFQDAHRQIDIIALTTENLVRVYREQLKSKILQEPCDIRIISLDPESPLWQCRLQDESDYSFREIQQVISHSSAFFKELAEGISNEIDVGSDLKGTLVVKHHTSLPHFAYFRADDTIIIGIYYAFTVGLKSHAMIVDNSASLVFRMLEKHFEAVWQRHGKEIVCITSRGIRSHTATAGRNDQQ